MRINNDESPEKTDFIGSVSYMNPARVMSSFGNNIVR